MILFVSFQNIFTTFLNNNFLLYCNVRYQAKKFLSLTKQSLYKKLKYGQINQHQFDKNLQQLQEDNSSNKSIDSNFTKDHVIESKNMIFQSIVTNTASNNLTNDLSLKNNNEVKYRSYSSQENTQSDQPRYNSKPENTQTYRYTILNTGNRVYNLGTQRCGNIVDITTDDHSYYIYNSNTQKYGRVIKTVIKTIEYDKELKSKNRLDSMPNIPRLPVHTHYSFS